MASTLDGAKHPVGAEVLLFVEEAHACTDDEMVLVVSALFPTDAAKEAAAGRRAADAAVAMHVACAVMVVWGDA